MGLFAPETLNIPPSRGFHRAFEEKLSLIRTQKFRRNETAIGSFASHYPINILRQWHSALYARESERELQLFPRGGISANLQHPPRIRDLGNGDRPQLDEVGGKLNDLYIGRPLNFITVPVGLVATGCAQGNTEHSPSDTHTRSPPPPPNSRLHAGRPRNRTPINATRFGTPLRTKPHQRRT
jgi:hypothetical protein